MPSLARARELLEQSERTSDRAAAVAMFEEGLCEVLECMDGADDDARTDTAGNLVATYRRKVVEWCNHALNTLQRQESSALERLADFVDVLIEYLPRDEELQMLRSNLAFRTVEEYVGEMSAPERAEFIEWLQREHP